MATSPDRAERRTVRGLMAAVLLVALAFKAREELARKHRCDATARAHLAEASRFLGRLGGRVDSDGSIRFERDWRLRATGDEYRYAVREAEDRVRLAREYQRAGWRPWVALPTDPYEPPSD